MKNYYIVQKGDTLYGISRQFGIPVETIKRENNLTNNTISVGQELKIPTSIVTSIYTFNEYPTEALYSISPCLIQTFSSVYVFPYFLI